MARGFLNGLREMLGAACPADVRAATMHFIGAVSQELIKPINEAWKTAMQGELTKLAASKATEEEPALLCAMAKVTLTKLGVDGPIAAATAVTAAAEAAEAAAAVGSAAEASAAAKAKPAAEAAGGSTTAEASAASLKAMRKGLLMEKGYPAHAAATAAASTAAEATEAEAPEAAMTVADAAEGSATEASAGAATSKVAAEAAAANPAGLAEAADGDDWFVEPGELSQLGKLLSPFMMAAKTGADAAKVERWKSSGALYVCVFLNGTGHNATNINEFWQVMNLPADRKSGFARLSKKF